MPLYHTLLSHLVPDINANISIREPLINPEVPAAHEHAAILNGYKSLKMKEVEDCIFHFRALIKAMDGFNQCFLSILLSVVFVDMAGYGYQWYPASFDTCRYALMG